MPEGKIKFSSFKIRDGKESWSLEFFSERDYDGFIESEGTGEFIQTAADGYSKEELTPCRYWEVYQDGFERLENPKKLNYEIKMVGEGMRFTYPKEIARLLDAMELYWVIPVERFLAESEEEVNAASSILEFYINADDELPDYTINLWNMNVVTPGEKK